MIAQVLSDMGGERAALLILLVVGHVFGDFLLQTRWMARRKERHWGVLLLHVAVVFVAHAAVLWPFLSWRVVAGLLGLSILHLVFDAARARFSSILEELPYIGGDDNWLTGNLVHASMAAALYIPLKERGRSVDEVGRMFYEAVEQGMSEQLANPPVPAHDAEAIRQAREKERNFDAWTLKREYPYNWVGEYVDGEGEPFDYGRDWIECGNVKLYKHYGVEELTPYMCLMDCIVFRASGKGLHRTKTLAQGDDRCDFRTSLSDPEISLEHLSAKTLREWGKCA